VVTVSWSPVNGATGYFIGRSVAPGGFKTVCQVCSTDPKYVDRGITAGAKHIYVVAALTPTGPTGRTRSNEVTPTGNGTGGTGGADSTGTDSTGTTPADTLLPRGVRLFTARNERGQVGPLVRLTWSPDPSAARYLIAFVDTVDDAHYRPEELFAERTIYTGTDTAAILNAPGDTARTNYVIVSENAHGRSEARYATRAAGPPPRDSTAGDSTASDSSSTGNDAGAGPQGVRNLKMVLKRGMPSHPEYVVAEVTWSADPKAERYHIAMSFGEDSTWQELQVKPAADTIYGVTYSPRYPREEWRASVISEDRSGRMSPRKAVTLDLGPPPNQLPEGVRELTATYRRDRLGDQVDLKWSADRYASKYRISSLDEYGHFYEFKVVSPPDTTLSVRMPPDLKQGALFRISSEDSYGYRSPSRVSNRVMGLPPVMPEWMIAGAVSSGEGVLVQWGQEYNANEYILSRSDDGGAFQEISRSDAGHPSYVDRAPAGRKLVYQVVNRNAYGDSPARRSEPLEWRVLRPPLGITEPSAVLEAGKVHLRWKGDERAERYEIRKSINGRAASQIAALTGDKTEYLDAQPLGLARVTYEIVSANRVGTSAPVRFPQSFGGTRDSLDLRSGGDSTGPVIKP
jgi:hypothetical protein